MKVRDGLNYEKKNIIHVCPNCKREYLKKKLVRINYNIEKKIDRLCRLCIIKKQRQNNIYPFGASKEEIKEIVNISLEKLKLNGEILE